MQQAVGLAAGSAAVLLPLRQQVPPPLQPRRQASVFTRPSPNRHTHLPQQQTPVAVPHTGGALGSGSSGRPEQHQPEGDISKSLYSQQSSAPHSHTSHTSHQDHLLQPITFSFSTGGTGTPRAPGASGTQEQPSTSSDASNAPSHAHTQPSFGSSNSSSREQAHSEGRQGAQASDSSVDTGHHLHLGQQHHSPNDSPTASSPLLSQQHQHQQQQQQQSTSPAAHSHSPPPQASSPQHSLNSAPHAASAGSGPASTAAPSSSSSSSSPGSQQPHSPPPPDREEVDSAVARAEAALNQLESSLDRIPQLPSANLHSSQLPMPPLQRKSALARMLGVLRTLAVISGGSVALVASHAFGLAIQLLSAVAGALAISYWGHQRGSLSASGAVTAFMVGVGTLCCSLRFGATLIAFFYVSSKLTHFKEELKAKLDDSAKKGGQRDWKQVLCNGLVPTGVAVAYGLVAGCVDVPLGPSAQLEVWRAKVLTLLAGAYLGWYSCCCGDTWASELGPLSRATPRLITSMRPVRRGTNGGVTLLGLAASAVGGTFVGLVFYLAGLVSPTLWIFEAQRATAARQWTLIPLGLFAGLVGSLVDSLLGATLQFSGFNHDTQRVTSSPGSNVTRITGHPILNNNLVNVVSATVTAALMACVAFWAFGV